MTTDPNMTAPPLGQGTLSIDGHLWKLQDLKLVVTRSHLQFVGRTTTPHASVASEAIDFIELFGPRPRSAKLSSLPRTLELDPLENDAAWFQLGAEAGSLTLENPLLMHIQAAGDTAGVQLQGEITFEPWEDGQARMVTIVMTGHARVVVDDD